MDIINIRSHKKLQSTKMSVFKENNRSELFLNIIPENSICIPTNIFIYNHIKYVNRLFLSEDGIINTTFNVSTLNKNLD